MSGENLSNDEIRDLLEDYLLRKRRYRDYDKKSTKKYDLIMYRCEGDIE
jgi:hypothetical protein